MVSLLERWLRGKNSKMVVSNELLGNVRVQVHKFKVLVMGTYNGRYKDGLYNVKFHFLDQVVEYLALFEKLEMLNSYGFLRFNVHIEQV